MTQENHLPFERQDTPKTAGAIRLQAIVASILIPLRLGGLLVFGWWYWLLTCIGGLGTPHPEDVVTVDWRYGISFYSF